MNRTESIEQTGFHDSSLTALSMDGNQVRLRIENVWVDDDNCYNVMIELGGVHEVTRNYKTIDNLRMEGEYANIIDLSRSGHTATLVVEWRSFAPRKNETCSYKLSFETFALRTEKQ